MFNCKEIINRVPVPSMIKNGWIAYRKKKLDQLEEVLKFFGVASSRQLTEVWQGYQAVYRQSRGISIHSEAVNAWLRQGEILVRKVLCAPFDRDRFWLTLAGIRPLTCEVPEVFYPQLTQLCAASGVAVVFVQALPKTGVSGTTRWLEKGKAVIQLSSRYKSNDQFWFTFFHEAWHILGHGRKKVFIESGDPDGTGEGEEEEADAFARDFLIPPDQLRAFVKNWDHCSLDPISRFAEEITIAPGIVVGRLQHDQLLLNTHGNKLKIYFDKDGFGCSPFSKPPVVPGVLR